MDFGGINTDLSMVGFHGTSRSTLNDNAYASINYWLNAKVAATSF
jgi:hypothetical protein